MESKTRRALREFDDCCRTGSDRSFFLRFSLEDWLKMELKFEFFLHFSLLNARRFEIRRKWKKLCKLVVVVVVVVDVVAVRRKCCDKQRNTKNRHVFLDIPSRASFTIACNIGSATKSQQVRGNYNFINNAFAGFVGGKSSAFVCFCGQ